MTVLKNKQSGVSKTAATYITLAELQQMQQEAEKVKVTDEINELMDMCFSNFAGITFMYRTESISGLLQSCV